jgi:hypothetical protein
MKIKIFVLNQSHENSNNVFFIVEVKLNIEIP